jgi:mono/diheme cytochrome c family protein
VGGLVLSGAILFALLSVRPSEPLASAEVLALGERVFADNCASCHGPQGEGHVLVNAPALDSSEHAWHHPDGQIQLLIKNGGVLMPSFADILNDEEIEAVIRYLQTWWMADQLAAQQKASLGDPLR